ncbi:carotenoid biosynthesis protein [Athalassotoga sp.]|uniref:carotenoid biosynthesis protein n=1 Tax=Athalassotoga sp. TaxID=2022597 RepID=UPI003D054041
MSYLNDILEDKRVLRSIISIYLVGVIGFILIRPVIILLTPYILFLFGLVILFKIFVDNGKKIIPLYVYIFLAGLFIEILGVKTGIIFGRYSYGNVLGLGIYGVPFLIGLNWVVVVFSWNYFSSNVLKARNFLFRSLSAAIFAVIFDILMEPSAIAFSFWKWNGSVPVQNYIAWFVISFLFSLSLKNVKFKSNLPWIYIIVQSIFFLILDIY